jgi:hypothetical protein
MGLINIAAATNSAIIRPVINDLRSSTRTTNVRWYAWIITQEAKWI